MIATSVMRDCGPSHLQPEISSNEGVSSSAVVVHDMRQLHLRLKDWEHPATEIRKESVDHRHGGKGMIASLSAALEEHGSLE